MLGIKFGLEIPKSTSQNSIGIILEKPTDHLKSSTILKIGFSAVSIANVKALNAC